MPANPDVVAAHLLADLSARAEDLLDGARRVRALAGGEAVHDLRVATRRIASALSVWRAALLAGPARRARGNLSRLRRTLGEVREHEVHFELLGEVLEQDPSPFDIAGRVLQSRLERRIERDHRGAARAAAPRRIARLLVRIERASAGLAVRLEALPGLIAEAEARVARREAKALAALRAAEGSNDGETLHAARIEAKKARYALECLNAAAVRDEEGPVRAFRRAQRELGRAHDWATLRDWVEQTRARRARRAARIDEPFALAEEDAALALLVERIAAREEEARAAFRAPGPVAAPAPERS